MKKPSLPLVAGLLLAAISLTFSATGLVHLFAGAGLAIVVMALGFEVAKVAITVHLLRHFRFRFVPLCLAGALGLLTAVSSVGVYGYLGKAYNAGRSTAVQGAGDVAVLSRQVADLTADRARLDAEIAAVPAAHSTNRRLLATALAPQMERIDAKLGALRDSLAARERQQVGHEQDVGELKFAATLFGMTQDGIAKAVITTLAFLLDPLAILLVLSSGAHETKETATIVPMSDDDIVADYEIVERFWPDENELQLGHIERFREEVGDPLPERRRSVVEPAYVEGQSYGEALIQAVEETVARDHGDLVIPVRRASARVKEEKVDEHLSEGLNRALSKRRRGTKVVPLSATDVARVAARHPRSAQLPPAPVEV